MERNIALFLAGLMATVSVASACTAASSNWIDFTLEAERNPKEIRASFRDSDRPRDRGDNRWSTTFASSEFAGLDLTALRAAGQHPIRFAIVREAGRMDCAGDGGDSYARGNCSFTPNAAFLSHLSRRGLPRPTNDQQFALMAVNARSELVDTLAAARYPTPDINDFIAATAVGVTGSYIQQLAQLGYRPSSVDNLVQFRALNITPDYVGGLARVGYRNLAPDDVVQLKALGVTPEFITGFESRGFRNLSVDKLVQLKALNITPEFVAAIAQRPGELPPIEQMAVLQSLERRR